MGLWRVARPCGMIAQFSLEFFEVGFAFSVGHITHLTCKKNKVHKVRSSRFNNVKIYKIVVTQIFSQCLRLVLYLYQVRTIHRGKGSKLPHRSTLRVFRSLPGGHLIRLPAQREFAQSLLIQNKFEKAVGCHNFKKLKYRKDSENINRILRSL